jgi:hypothetical protein
MMTSPEEAAWVGVENTTKPTILASASEQ